MTDPTSAGWGFNTGPGLFCQQTQATLRDKRPEKQPGGFRSPGPCTCFLRSRRGYSFPSIPFAGCHQPIEHMYETRGPSQLYSRREGAVEIFGRAWSCQMAFVRTLRCPVCPVCVRSGTPITPDTLNQPETPSTRKIHTKVSEVSGVSGLISFPSRNVCVRARLTRLRGSRKQTGQTGHVEKVTMKSAAPPAESRKQGVRCERTGRPDTTGQTGHLSGLTRGVRA